MGSVPFNRIAKFSRVLALTSAVMFISGCVQSWGKFWDVTPKKRAAVDVCTITASYSEVIRTDFGEDLLFHLRAQRDKGSTGIASADTTSITGIANTLKWSGGVLAPNGKIYAIPRQSDVVAIINPATNTIDQTTITGLTTTPNKWVGGVLAPNGKIYGIPSASTSVLIIDPAIDTADTATITGLTGTTKWFGGVLAPNGKIYGMPHNVAIGNLLIVDPETNTADISSVTGLTGSTDKWFGAVLAPNTKIYGIPFDSPIGLIINPNSNGAFCDAVLKSAYLNKY